jgi:SAM-dependent methyltransferase
MRTPKFSKLLTAFEATLGVKSVSCNQLSQYLSRYAQKRRTRLIDEFMPRGTCILDLGCGNGAYMPFLRKKADMVVGLDVLLELCRVAKLRNRDSHVVCAHAMKLPFRRKAFDGVWASEIIEHLPTWNLLDEIESVSRKAVLITLPNPYFPDYASPDHYLRYTWATLNHVLRMRKREGWRYTIRGIGFHNILVPKWFKQLTTRLVWFFPLLSPSLVILGKRTVKEWKTNG